MEFSNKRLPKHVAIITDGNGRWATKKGLPRSLGHKAGVEPIKDITLMCAELGIQVLTFYVFSTENWSRPKEEVEFLMELFIEFFKRLREENKCSVKVKHIGLKDNLSHELLLEIDKTEQCTENNTGMVLNIALNYGARSEIIDATKRLLKDIKLEKLTVDDISETTISSYLFTSQLPDVDLIIRTSGESRISNFLLWQSAKAKIWTTPVLWPDFTKEHLSEALND